MEVEPMNYDHLLVSKDPVPEVEPKIDPEDIVNDVNQLDEEDLPIDDQLDDDNLPGGTPSRGPSRGYR